MPECIGLFISRLDFVIFPAICPSMYLHATCIIIILLAQLVTYYRIVRLAIVVIVRFLGKRSRITNIVCISHPIQNGLISVKQNLTDSMGKKATLKGGGLSCISEEVLFR
jgi:hypothetical protein